MCRMRSPQSQLRLKLELADEAVRKALANFEGIDRRMQVLADEQTPFGRIMFIDDYGHHPTEIAATLEAVSTGWPDRRLVVVFQPHRFTRTRDLLKDFAAVLATVNPGPLFLTEVYAAGEEAIPGADGRSICGRRCGAGRGGTGFCSRPEAVARDARG